MVLYQVKFDKSTDTHFLHFTCTRCQSQIRVSDLSLTYINFKHVNVLNYLKENTIFVIKSFSAYAIFSKKKQT